MKNYVTILILIALILIATMRSHAQVISNQSLVIVKK